MRKLGLIVILVSAAFMLISCKGGSDKNKKIFTVGITQYNDSEFDVEIRKGIVQGLRESGFKESDNIVYKNQQAKNNSSYVTQINKKFIDDGCDMIVAIGTSCAVDAIDVSKDTKTKVVYAGVRDTKSIGLSDKDFNPLVNATGIINKYDINGNLSFIKTIMPNVGKLGIMYTKNDASLKKLIDEYKYYGSSNNIDIVTIAINTEKDIELAYNTLIKKVDAFMIINDEVVESNADFLINKSIELKKPVFATNNTLVKNGAIASYSVDLLNMGKEVGKIAGDILNGKNINEIQVKEIKDSKLYVNKKTLDIYNINVDENILKDAYIYE